MIGAASGSTNRQFQLISTTTITSTGSQDYTVPSGTAYLVFECYGAGGCGGGGNSTVAARVTSYKGGGGGGGGSSVIHRYESELLIDGDVIRFTVGTGGVEGGAVATAGGTGGSTSPITHRDSGLAIKYTFAGPTAEGGGRGLSPTTFSAGAGSAGVASGANLFNNNGYAGGNNHASLGNGGVGGAYTLISTALQDPEESFITTTINPVLDIDGWGISIAGSGGIASSNTAAADGSSPSNGGGGGYNKATPLDPSGGAGGNGKVIVRAYG